MVRLLTTLAVTAMTVTVQADGSTIRTIAALLNRLERDAHEVGAACARPHHNTLQIDDFHYRRRAGGIAIIGQRQLEADPRCTDAAGPC